MDTAVVILNWNGLGFLQKFLPVLAGSLEGCPADIVIADNDSDDGSAAWVRKNWPGIRWIQFRKNHGFTGGYNRALEILRHRPSADDAGDNGTDTVPYKYYVLLNSDVEVTRDWLFPLTEWMDLHEDCAMCAPKLLSWADRDKFEYAGAAGGLIDGLGFPFCRGRVHGRVEADRGQYNNPEDVMWASGACLMVRADVFHALHGFDDRFFAHMEEIDLCWRARLEGWRVCVVPRSVVYHVGGGTLANGSPDKLFLNFRNNLLMLENNLPRTCALEMFYTATAPDEDEAVSADGITNCLNSFDEAPDNIKERLVTSCASLGEKAARHLIFRRKLVDGCAAAVYLLKGRKDYFKAVLKAHREYKSLKKTAKRGKGTEDFLVREISGGGTAARVMLDIDLSRRAGDRVRTRGTIDRSTVLLEARYKEKVFERLREIMQQ